jgi:hypothetical protein
MASDELIAARHLARRSLAGPTDIADYLTMYQYE